MVLAACGPGGHRHRDAGGDLAGVGQRPGGAHPPHQHRHDARRLPRVPGRQPVEHRHLPGAGAGRLGRHHRPPRREPAPGLRQQPVVRDPVRRSSPPIRRRCRCTFDAYGDQSDPGPYPIPLNAPIEAGSDAHVLALQQGTCQLYELFAASAGQRRLDGRLRRPLGPALERPAARRVDVGRRRRPAHPARAAALRRGGQRGRHPRHPHDVLRDVRRPHPPGHPRRLVEHRPRAAADGAAAAPAGRLRPHARTPAPRG